MTPAPLRFAISSAASADFVRLSGDANPLHVDPLYARRLQFGGTVVHGIHTLLAAWDLAFARLPEAKARALVRIAASFPNPVGQDQPIDCGLNLAADGASATLVADSGGRRVLSLRLDFAAGPALAEGLDLAEHGVPLEAALDQGFPPSDQRGSLDLGCDGEIAARLFPWLLGHYGPRLLAPILASTRLVGMKCPGLHSVFSGLSLDIAPGAEAGPQRLEWSVERLEDRFRMVKIRVFAPGVQGRLDAFFRPKPVAQADYATVLGQVTPGQFAGQHALVIGGTRGAGEVTAKLLAAGGAQVVVSYHQGSGDAERVAAEIRSGGGHCAVLGLDVAAGAPAVADLFGPGLAPTHCYYFASPHIAPNKSRSWDAGLFACFCRIYVDAFADLVRALADGPNPACTFFYPSSIYVEQPEKGFAEYAAAKGAGEALCVQLAARYPQARFLAPRLPRMATDQTASIVPIKSESALDTMLAHLIEPSLPH